MVVICLFPNTCLQLEVAYTLFYMNSPNYKAEDCYMTFWTVMVYFEAMAIAKCVKVKVNRFVIQPTRISGRHKGKRPRYAEPGMSGSDEEAIEVDNGDEEEPPQKLPKLSQQGTPAQSKSRKRQVFRQTCVQNV